MAPEILHKEGYGLKADVFSCGIILYAMYVLALFSFSLTGVNPFAAPTVESILENNKRCFINYPRDLWQAVSSEAQDLVQKLTAREPNARLTAAAALDHPWFLQGAKQTTCLASAVEHMRKYCAEYGPICNG